MHAVRVGMAVVLVRQSRRKDWHPMARAVGHGVDWHSERSEIFTLFCTPDGEHGVNGIDGSRILPMLDSYGYDI